MARSTRSTERAHELQSFNSTLESPSVLLPFPGAYARVGIIYDMDRAMNLEKEADTLFAELIEQNELIQAQLQKIRDDFANEWSETLEIVEAAQKEGKSVEEDISAPLLAAEKEVLQKVKELTARAEELADQLVLDTANHIVIRLDPWPYKEPADISKFSKPVLNWIVKDGLLQAAKLLKIRSLGASSMGFTSRRQRVN